MKTLKQLRGILESPVKQDKSMSFGKITEESLEEDVEKQLRAVVKKKKEADIKFKSGTSVPIDPEAASVILKTLDSLNSSNKKKAAEVEKNKREREVAKRRKDAEEKREADKKKREREAKKKYDASPAGKAAAKKKRDELEKHFAKQDDPHARHAGGMYQDH